MRVHRQLKIDAPPAAVWRCLVEPELQKRWITQLVDETPDDASAVGVGATSSMRLREGDQVVTYRSKVTAWEPERHLSIQLTGGTFAEDMAMDVRYDLVPEAAGTTLDYDVVVPMKGFASKVLTPLLWLVASTNSIKDLARLSVVAETA